MKIHFTINILQSKVVDLALFSDLAYWRDTQDETDCLLNKAQNIEFPILFDSTSDWRLIAESERSEHVVFWDFFSEVRVIYSILKCTDNSSPETQFVGHCHQRNNDSEDGHGAGCRYIH
jgi:hypothetical protein